LHWCALGCALALAACSSKIDGPAPTLASVTPSTITLAVQPATVTLGGGGFSPVVVGGLGDTPAVQMPQVFLINPAGVSTEVPAPGISAPDSTGTLLSVTIPKQLVPPTDATMPAVTYSVEVINPDGKSAILANALTVVPPHEFTITGIDPPFGCTCSNTTVTITSGAAFVSTPTVSMQLHDGTGPVIQFKRVAYVDASTLTAVVPAGAAVNTDPSNLYDVTVANPPSDGGVGVLANGFRVVMHPVPEIDAIVPARGAADTDIAVKIFGANFRNAAKVELLDRTLTAQATVASVAPVSATEIDTTIHTPTTEGAYLVRVTDLDEMTYSTFSDFVVGATGPSGNLHPFTDTTPLVTGRRMLAGTVARDDLGNTYLYAIAGDTGAAGAPLATWEVAQLGKFGDLGAWNDNGGANPLSSKLHGTAAATVPVFGTSTFVPIKSYVYVAGGRDDAGTVSAAIQRAEVLRAADAPANVVAKGSTTAGTLAVGTWYYKVSAVLAGGTSGDPDNPGGETLASDEAIVTLGGNGAVDLSWDAVTVNSIAAVSYNVYRTDAVNGASQKEHLIANVTTNGYTDTGATAGTKPPLAAGSLGVWMTQTQTLMEARWGHQMALLTDPASGARALYVIGGKTDNATGYLGTVEVATVDAMGHLSSSFGETGTLAMTARAFFSLAVETEDNVSGFTGVGRLFATGGVTSAGASSAIEISDVATLGTNAAWAPYAGSGYSNHAGPMCTIVGDKMWAMGGAKMATDTTFSNIESTGRDIPFLLGVPQTPIQSAAQTMTPSRALGVALVGAGFMYYVGGTSDGSNALSTNQQSF
jgi:hypothetical protein